MQAISYKGRIFKRDFIAKHLPCRCQDSNLQPSYPRSFAHLCGPFLQPKAIFHRSTGPELVASTLGDLVAVASNQLWTLSEHFQGLYRYIQPRRRTTALLTTPGYRDYLSKIDLNFSLAVEIDLNT